VSTIVMRKLPTDDAAELNQILPERMAETLALKLELCEPLLAHEVDQLSEFFQIGVSHFLLATLPSELKIKARKPQPLAAEA